tara:strand:+ start:111 stop:398 length:288 start_codon:yes stop_codon:yes gene_type:complete
MRIGGKIVFTDDVIEVEYPYTCAVIGKHLRAPIEFVATVSLNRSLRFLIIKVVVEPKFKHSVMPSFICVTTVVAITRFSFECSVIRRHNAVTHPI